MSKKSERISKIKTYLRMQSKPSSVSEIHEALTKRMHLSVSRKTVERDLLEMTNEKNVDVISGTPSKFVLNKPIEVEVILKVEELREIIKLLSQESDLYLKLNKYLD